MGIVNNECVVATTWDDKAVHSIRQWIKEQTPDHQTLFAVLPSLVNGYQTIILAPDGSKKGWGTAKEGELLRDSFIKKLQEFDYEDDSNPFAFVEVGYGEYGQKVLRGNNTNCYDDSEYAAA